MAVSPEEEAAVRSFYAPLQRALRDLAAGLGIGRRDLPHAQPVLVAFGLAVYRAAYAAGHKAGRDEERARRAVQERPTVRQAPKRRLPPSGVVETPVVELGWEDEDTPLADEKYPSQAEIDLRDLETSPGYPRSKRRRP